MARITGNAPVSAPVEAGGTEAVRSSGSYRYRPIIDAAAGHSVDGRAALHGGHAGAGWMYERGNEDVSAGETVPESGIYECTCGESHRAFTSTDGREGPHLPAPAGGPWRRLARTAAAAAAAVMRAVADQVSRACRESQA